MGDTAMNKILRQILTTALLVTVWTASGAIPSAYAGNPDKIIVVHTNDIHGRVATDEKMVIGMAKLKTFVERLQAANPNLLILDAGDAFHGLPIITLGQGEGMIGLMNNVGYDAMVPGNHDFNYGWRRLLTISQGLNFPMVAANVRQKDGSLLFPPYTIKTVGGYRIGILGLATPETSYMTNPANIEGLSFTDPIAEAAEIVSELREKRKVDIVIAITHLGLNPDSPTTSRLLADSVPGIDLIVDGHSHTVLPVGQNTKGALIVSTGCYTNYFGKVILEIENKKVISARAMLYSNLDLRLVPADATIAATTKKLQDNQAFLGKSIVGNSSVDLDGEIGNVRTRQTNLGAIVAEAAMTAGRADIAIINGGSIRASISAGEISKLDVISVLPFGNLVITKKITGAQLKAALENGLFSYPTPVGRFPQVAGFTYVADYSRPAGDRVTAIDYQGRPVSSDQVLLLATNDFLASGGDGYIMLAGSKLKGEYLALDEAVITYLQTTPFFNQP
jgi:5'-nucleotidase